MSDSSTYDDDSRIPVGSVLDGYYEVTCFLGAGGFADVYGGVQLDTGMKIAIKVLREVQNPKSSDVFEKRFLQEAKVAASIRHPNVVTIFACRERMRLRLPDGEERQTKRLYIVMDLLEGLTLEDELLGSGPMAPQRAIPLVISCLDGLGVGHGLGVVHKDLKPANLFLTGVGTRVESMMILDYGVARVGQSVEERLTMTGQMAMTPQYAAPEYVESLTATPALDVYQMGLILSEMFTGEPVVGASSLFECLITHTKGVALPEFLINSDLGPVLLKATSLLYTERYVDAASFAEALERVDVGKVAEQFTLGGAPSASTARRESRVLGVAETFDSVNAGQVVGLAETGEGPMLPLDTGAGAVNPVSMASTAAVDSVKVGSTSQATAVSAVAGPSQPVAVAAVAASAGAMQTSHTVKEAAIEGPLSASTSAPPSWPLPVSSPPEGPRAAETPRPQAEPQRQPPLQPQPPAQPQPQAPPKKKGGGVWLGLGLGCVGVVVLVAFGFIGLIAIGVQGAGNVVGPCGDADECFDAGMGLYRAKASRRDYDQAYANFYYACDDGHADACAWVSEMRAYGHGTDRDVELSLDFARRACDGGSARGCNALGVKYHRGLGVDRDDKKVLEHCRVGCEGNDRDGCSSMGAIYELGIGVKPSLSKAATYFRKACDLDDASACMSMGGYFKHGIGGKRSKSRSKKAYAKAFDLAKASCDLGHPNDCMLLGDMYVVGIGVDKDLARGASLYKESCELGSSDGCDREGGLYLRGDGVRKDENEAAARFREACDLYSISGCTNYAYVLEMGIGASKDVEHAVELYRDSCDLDNPVACNNLGNLLGQHPRHAEHKEEKDEVYAHAVSLYKRYCDAGAGFHCTYLGRIYEAGVIVKASKNRAQRYYNKGCDYDDEAGCDAAKALKLKR